MKFNNKSLLRYLYEIGVLLLGNAGVAFLVAAFVIPHNIIMGGATGIGIVLDPILPLDTPTRDWDTSRPPSAS